MTRSGHSKNVTSHLVSIRMKNRATLLSKIGSVILLSAVLAITTPVVQASTLSFTEMVDDGGPNLSGQLSATVTQIMDGAEFKFYNNVGFDSSITGVFFDIGSSNIAGIEFSLDNSSSGVDFKAKNNPTLPEGNTLTTEFDADYGETKDGPNTNGVDEGGEYASFLVAFGTGFQFDTLITAISDGVFRVGLHVTSIALEPNSLGGEPADGSDAYINVSTVPVPAAAWLFGSALLGLFATRRRKNQKILTNL